MLFLSEVLRRPVKDAGGERIAGLEDLVGRWQIDRKLLVSGLVARVGSRRFFISWQQVSNLNAGGAQLTSYQLDFRQFERREGEILLAADVMDRRMVDVRRRKVIRVNDVLLSGSDGLLWVDAVDVGFSALLRRLLPGGMVPSLTGVSRIDWADVEWIPSEGTPDVKASFPRLAKLHPVEVAHIVDELPNRQAADIVESLDDEDAAEVLSEMSEEHQAALLLNLEQDRAADILEEMEPDDAADLLSRLPAEDAGELLHRMEVDDARDVLALMNYKEGTAGGLMTSRFVIVPQGWTAAEVLGLLRRMEDRPETVTHLLVVDEPGSETLVGMLPLLEIVVAPPGQPLAEFMARDVPSVKPDTPTSEVARKMAEYNLAVLPVVEDGNRVVGIVAVDDVVEEMLPERWRRRLPRLFG